MSEKELSYQAPPRTFSAILSYVGPGAVLAALAVGGGELVMNPRAGAMYGFGLAWLVVFGLFFKYFITQEIGKFPTITGKSIFDSWGDIKSWIPLTFDGAALIARGFSIAGNGLTLGTILYWAFPNTISHVSWAVVCSVISGIILYIGLYNVMEKVSMVMVGIMMVTLVICAVAVMTGKTWGELLVGVLSIGKVPSGAWKEALPLLGWSGEGAIGTVLYAAWIKERGLGLNLGGNGATNLQNMTLTDQQIEDGNLWIKSMRTDALISFVIQLLACLAFMIAGAVILKPLGLVPHGKSIATEQARLFTQVLGPWAQQLFVLGSAAAMFTTLMVAIDCETRLGQDFIQRLSPNKKMDPDKLYRGFLLISVLITVVFSFTKAPLPLLKFGAVMDGAVMMPIAGWLTWKANKMFLPEPFQPQGVYGFMLMAAIAILGVFGVIALFWLIL